MNNPRYEFTHKQVIKSSNTNPIVFLLDLDNTIQGNVVPQIVEYNLINSIEILNAKTKRDILKRFSKCVQEDLKKGLLRPYFKRFILKMREEFPNVEFFVYTASEDAWAKVIVNIIEKYLDLKINKVIFSRKHCTIVNGLCMKSIEMILPIVKNTLKNKYYPKSSVPDGFLNNVFLVDNNYVLLPGESNRLIHCNNYDATVVIDPLRNLSFEMVKRHYKALNTLLYPKHIFSHYFDFMANHYKMLSNQLKAHAHVNKTSKNDKFWKHLWLYLKKHIEINKDQSKMKKKEFKRFINKY
jgi:hypothetical protein